MSQTIFLSQVDLEKAVDCACNTVRYTASDNSGHEIFQNNKTGKILSIDKKGLTEEQQRAYYETALYGYWGQAALKVLEKREPDIHSRPANYQSNQFKLAMQDTMAAVNETLREVAELGNSGNIRPYELINMIEGQQQETATGQRIQNTKEVVEMLLSSKTSFEALYNLTHYYYDFNKEIQTQLTETHRSGSTITFSALPVKTKEQSRQM